jgi:hypothetical protein
MRHRIGIGIGVAVAVLAGIRPAWSQEQPISGSAPGHSRVFATTDGAVEDLTGEAGPQVLPGTAADTATATLSTYADDCASCESPCMSKFRHHVGHGRKIGLGLRSLGSRWLGNTTTPCDSYECANCYSQWDCEKRLYIGYVNGAALKRSTRLAVNDFDGAQVGAEFLPWVCQDGSVFFARTGFTVMYQYSHFLGGSVEGQIVSRRSGGAVAIEDGTMHSLILAPTYRVDFDVFGVRLSPNASAGITFDWVKLDERAGTGGRTVNVDAFKYTGFDAGFYSKLALDFGITEKINFSIGMDFRASQTDVMQDDNLRKHMGFIIGMSHTF